MKHRQLTIVVLVFLMVNSALLSQNSPQKATAKTSSDFYVGIDVAYEDSAAIKELVDEASAFTNLFIIGCTGITHNYTRLNETCQYLYEKGLSFIVYQERPLGYVWGSRNNVTISNWTQLAKTQWGEQFLGFYYLDEPGGKQLDLEPGWNVLNNPKNGQDAANQFNSNVSRSVNWFRSGYSDWTDVSLFASDYSLYWFDYKAGYDTLFAEFGWNYSRQLNVALCRGAATAQNKEWGVMITWTYTEPPYIESGEELYNDLVLAYNNGAKYIVIFDSNEEYTQGILKDEHLNALKQFWKYAQDNSRNSELVETRTALVLPEGYAYGFRGPNDKIWGLWNANEFAYHLSVDVNSLLEQYGTKLDIIYDDYLEAGITYGYRKLIYWNDTSQMPSLSPTASPSPSATPSSSPTASLALHLSPSSLPSSLPSQTASPKPSSTQQSISTQDPQDGALELPSFVYPIITVGVFAGIVGAALLVRKKRPV
jgi:hypothetical protein